MSSKASIVPFWVDMTILFSMTLPVMWGYAVTGWAFLMPVGAFNLCAALGLILFIRHIRTTSARRDKEGQFARRRHF